MKLRYLTAAGTIALLSVSGCGQNPTGISLLEEPATASDELPAEFDSHPLEADSARFATEHDGVSYFLAKPAENEAAASVCIVAVEPGVSGCSGSAETAISFLGVEARTVQDDADIDDLVDEGWEAVHDNLLVR